MKIVGVCIFLSMIFNAPLKSRLCSGTPEMALETEVLNLAEADEWCQQSHNLDASDSVRMTFCVNNSATAGIYKWVK
jgi:hypothetical protein